MTQFTISERESDLISGGDYERIRLSLGNRKITATRLEIHDLTMGRISEILRQYK